MHRTTVRIILAAFALALASGCAGVQSIPVSTDPSGAQVFLDGKAVCAATPCSVEAAKDADHLLTVIKDGYRQKDITLKRATGGPGGSITPSVVTLRLRAADQLDITNQDEMIDTAVGLGVKALKRVLEDGRARPEPEYAPQK